MNESQLAQMHSVLVGALSPDNAVRGRAEAVINEQLETNLDMFILGLVQLLRTSSELQVRSLCAIVLRKKLPNGEPVLFDKLPENLQETIKSELLAAIANESERYVRNQVCDTVAELAEVTLFKDSWPALLPFLFQCCAASSEPLRVSGLLLLGKLADSCADNVIHPHVDKILPVYASAFASSSMPVRVSALVACCKSVVNLDDEQDTKRFQQLLPDLFKVLGDVMSAKDQDSGKKILSGLVEIGTEEATFFRPQLETVANAMHAIGQTVDFEDGIRQLCMELLVAIAEGAPGMVRKQSGFIKIAVNLALNLMLSVEDDPTWCQQPENPDIYDNSNFDCGEISIDRLAQAVGGKKIVPIVFPAISSLVGTRSGKPEEDWKFRHAGLRALSQVGEVLSFDQLPMEMVVGFVRDPHPRVRYAAINAIGQLSLDFAPELQSSCHQAIFPALIEPLNDSLNPRIQTHALAALFNFIDQCEEKIMDRYVDGLMPRLLALLKGGPQMVQEQVMTTIAAVAGAAAAKFSKYYDQTVPLIKEIIVRASGKEHRTLRSRAMESVTFIGMAVGKDMFRKDAKEIMNIFLEIMKTGQIAPDDVSQQYMLQAWTRICTTLGQEFIPCLPFVIPSVFEAAKKDADWSLLKNENDNDGATPTAIRLSSRGFTSSLEDKATACSMLCSFVHDLKEGYLPYIAETAKIMIPLMSFTLNDEVRSYAISIQPDLITSAVEALKANKTDVNFVKQLFLDVTGSLLNCFRSEQDTEILMTLVGSLQSCIGMADELAAQTIDSEALKTIGLALLKLLTASHKRIEKREEQKKSEDFDDEAEASLIGENEAEDELNFMVSECVGTLIKTHKQAFLPTFDLIVPEILRMLAPQSLPGTRKIALFIWDDLVEHVGAPVGKYFQHFVPALLQYVNDESPELRQASAYGLKVCAEYGQAAFQPYVDESVKQLLNGINARDSRKPEVASATDNMISALARICTHQDRPALLPVWLNCLPITVDQTESEVVYGTLCSLVEQNNRALLGDNMANLPKVLSVLAEICDGEMLEEELNERVRRLLKQMKGMPADMLTKVVQAMPPASQKALRKAFSTV